MRFYDFEYDGITLRNKGYMICKFGSDGIKTISNGSNITFKTVPFIYGQKHELTNIKYDECLTTTFQICKHPCDGNTLEIAPYEITNMMRWLNRKEFHKLKFIDVEYMNIFWECTFNISKIEMEGKVYGLELEVITNRPFALREKIEINIINLENNGKKTIVSMSDEIGYIYPKTKITIDEDGDLEIYNALEDRTMKIANCSKGEIITIDYPLIETSESSHKIQNDFNWNYLRLANTFVDRRNRLTISIPCQIKLEYNPIVKLGF